MPYTYSTVSPFLLQQIGGYKFMALLEWKIPVETKESLDDLWFWKKQQPHIKYLQVGGKFQEWNSSKGKKLALAEKVEWLSKEPKKAKLK